MKKQKFRKQYQRQFNHKLKELNQCSVTDKAMLGRFVFKQIRCSFERFQDNSGGILYAMVRAYDKATNLYKDYIIEYAPYYCTFNYRLSYGIANDFVVEECNFRCEKNAPDYRNVPVPDYVWDIKLNECNYWSANLASETSQN